MASWGSLIAEVRTRSTPSGLYWWLIVFPGTALVLTLLALNFLGDGLRDVWTSKPAIGRLKNTVVAIPGDAALARALDRAPRPRHFEADSMAEDDRRGQDDHPLVLQWKNICHA